MRILYSLLFIFVWAACAVPVSAHVNGVSYEKTKDGYQIDAGYGAPAPAVGESLVLDFRLRKEGKDVEFSDTWIKITSETGAVVFASGIHNSEFGGPRMSYVFPAEGKYDISMRFENQDGTLVEDSFPITVLPADQIGRRVLGFRIESYIFLILGVALGILSIYVPTMIRALLKK